MRRRSRRDNDRHTARTENLISLCFGLWLGLGGDMLYTKLKSILDNSYD